MSSDGKPFIFTLSPEELSQIVDFDIKGKGGAQTLFKILRLKLEETSSLEFDNWELGQLIRYMTVHGDGGFETRLRSAFARSFRSLFIPVLEVERRA